MARSPCFSTGTSTETRSRIWISTCSTGQAQWRPPARTPRTVPRTLRRPSRSRTIQRALLTRRRSFGFRDPRRGSISRSSASTTPSLPRSRLRARWIPPTRTVQRRWGRSLNPPTRRRILRLSPIPARDRPPMAGSSRTFAPPMEPRPTPTERFPPTARPSPPRSPRALRPCGSRSWAWLLPPSSSRPL